MRLFTIGFTKKTARDFFEKLKASGVKRLIDVRLNTRSQLSGFAKQADLEYFLTEIGGIEYLHLPVLGPTRELLSRFRKRIIGWDEYEAAFLRLLAERRVEEHLDPETFENSCLLCSEDKPDFCHRRLVGEYLQKRWSNLTVVHL